MVKVFHLPPLLNFDNLCNFTKFKTFTIPKMHKQKKFLIRCTNALKILSNDFGIFFRIYITCQMDSYPTFKLLFDGSKVFLPLPTPPGLLFVALPPFPWLFPNEGLLLLNCTPGLKGIEANISGLGISMGPVGLFFGPSPGKYVGMSIYQPGILQGSRLSYG